MTYTKQALEMLRRNNFDDRAEPIGARHRDIATQALETFAVGKDRLLFRLFLRDNPRHEFTL